jgi:hypothetical protein
MTIARVFIVLALAASFAQGQQGKDAKDLKPPTDDPPVGKGKLYLVEDFETTEVGQIPAGYTKQGALGVVDDVAHTGKRSLRVEPAVNGPRRITTKSEALAALGGQHWGRLYFRIQLPAPECASGVIHSTIVSGKAQSPQHMDGIEVRPVDTILNSKQMFGYIYNVQPEKRPEFGKGSEAKWKFTDQWTLVEWFVDHATQTYRLFVEGKEVKDIAFMKGAGGYEKSEIPAVFDSMSFGWWNYQQAGKGFTAWIDDIALAKDRIGLRGLPAAKPKK